MGERMAEGDGLDGAHRGAWLQAVSPFRCDIDTPAGWHIYILTYMIQLHCFFPEAVTLERGFCLILSLWSEWRVRLAPKEDKCGAMRKTRESGRADCGSTAGRLFYRYKQPPRTGQLRHWPRHHSWALTSSSGRTLSMHRSCFRWSRILSSMLRVHTHSHEGPGRGQHVRGVCRTILYDLPDWSLIQLGGGGVDPIWPWCLRLLPQWGLVHDRPTIPSADAARATVHHLPLPVWRLKSWRLDVQTGEGGMDQADCVLLQGESHCPPRTHPSTLEFLLHGRTR